MRHGPHHFPAQPARPALRRVRHILRLSVLSLTLLAPTALASLAAAPLPTGQLLRDGTGLYPRVVRLQHAGAASGHLLSAVVVPPSGSQAGHSPIYESTDGGKTWSAEPVGTVSDPQTAHGLCCTTLFELPVALGNSPAGTLLWAGSVGQDAQDRRMALRVWKSADQGRSWAYLSSCAVAATPGGLWEPEFSVAADGALVCHFSDETQPGQHSQFLAEVTSHDGGATWSGARQTVALSGPALRPGMPVVRRLGNGRYTMTYEICALPGANCAAHIRFSADGLDWGDPQDPGQRIISNTGHYFAHTPVLAWAPGPTPQGTLLLSGQILQDESGVLPAEGTGRTLMLSTTGGEGNWTEFAAPFALENVYDDYCPNYSSPLLPSVDGKSVLELATNYDDGQCKPYFGSGPIPSILTISHQTRGSGLAQLNYAGAWKADAGAHFSSTSGAAVTLKFAGSGVTVYGSGQGRVALDGGPFKPFTSSDAAPLVAADLKPGTHTLTLRVSSGKLALRHVQVNLGVPRP